MTKDELLRIARQRYESLWEISPTAADDARQQAGLSWIWAWDQLTVRQLFALCVACRIRFDGMGLSVS